MLQLRLGVWTPLFVAVCDFLPASAADRQVFAVHPNQEFNVFAVAVWLPRVLAMINFIQSMFPPSSASVSIRWAVPSGQYTFSFFLACWNLFWQARIAGHPSQSRLNIFCSPPFFHSSFHPGGCTCNFWACTLRIYCGICMWV